MSAVSECLRLLAETRDLPAPLCHDAILELVSGAADEAQAAAFLMGLRVKGETVEELLGCAQALRSQCLGVTTEWELLDTCGTGGDGSSTLNISTLAALVLASLGVKVAKHGNRSVTSRCGSADLIEALGVPLLSDPAQVTDSLGEHSFAFLFAPHFHPSTARVAAVRRKLGVRTIFNLLGPLVNPASARYQVIGVFAPGWCRPMAEVALRLGLSGCLVVHSEGTDELTLSVANQVCWARPEGLEGLTLDLSFATPSELGGGDPQENALLSRQLLQGKLPGAASTVALNAAAGLMVSGRAKCWREAFATCQEAIASGQAWELVERLARL